MFTPQLQAGGPRYGNHTRMGNWREEVNRTEMSLRDFERRRDTGSLTSTRDISVSASLTLPVGFPSRPPGDAVRYGDSVQLVHVAAFRLACNVFEDAADPRSHPTYGVPEASAQARNTWVLLPGSSTQPADGLLGAPVRYGDVVVISTHPELTTGADGVIHPSLLLTSVGANCGLTGGGRKQSQDVVVAGPAVGAGPASLWRVVHVSNDRRETDGTSVAAGDAVQLMHVMTGAALAAAPRVDGAAGVGGDSTELAPFSSGVLGDANHGCVRVHCRTYRSSAGHVSMRHDAGLPLVPAAALNVWRLDTAPPAGVSAGCGSSGGGGHAFATAAAPLTEEAVAAAVRRQLTTQLGWHGLRSLHSAMSVCAVGGVVSAGDALAALVNHGAAPSSEEELRLLLQHKDQQPTVVADRLLRTVRGDSFTAARRDVTQRAWDALVGGGGATSTSPAVGTTSSTSLALSALCKRYDAAWDPRVRAGALSVEEARLEFPRQWQQLAGPGSSAVATGASSSSSTAVVSPGAGARTITRVGKAAAHTTPTPAASATPGPLITRADFDDYYQDVAACVPLLSGSEDHFIGIVASVWHLPGEGSWQGLRSK